LANDAEGAAAALAGLEAAQQGTSLVLEGDDLRATGWAGDVVVAAELSEEETKKAEKAMREAYNKERYGFREELVKNNRKSGGKKGKGGTDTALKKSVLALVKKCFMGKIKGKEGKYIVVAVNRKRKSKNNPEAFWQCLVVRSSQVEGEWFGRKWKELPQIIKDAGKKKLILKADVVMKMVGGSAGRSSIDIDSSGESSDGGYDSDDSTGEKGSDRESDVSSSSSSGESESEDELEGEGGGGGGGVELDEDDVAAATVGGGGGRGTESCSDEESSSDKAGASELQVRKVRARERLTGADLVLARARERKEMKRRRLEMN
jgi:hypothetical protein